MSNERCVNECVSDSVSKTNNNTVDTIELEGNCETSKN